MLQRKTKPGGITRERRVQESGRARESRYFMSGAQVIFEQRPEGIWVASERAFQGKRTTNAKAIRQERLWRAILGIATRS